MNDRNPLAVLKNALKMRLEYTLPEIPVIYSSGKMLKLPGFYIGTGEMYQHVLKGTTAWKVQVPIRLCMAYGRDGELTAANYSLQLAMEMRPILEDRGYSVSVWRPYKYALEHLPQDGVSKVLVVYEGIMYDLEGD